MKITDEWEEFTAGPPERHECRIHVTLNRMNSLIMNRNTYQLMGRPEAVVLLFSQRQQKMLVTATHRRNSKGFPVVPAGTGWRVQISPLVRKYGIRIDRTQKFVGAEVDDDAMLILDLTNTMTVAITRPRRKKSK